MIKPMKLRKLITSVLLIASVVFLYFGPYNNKNLFEQLKFLESKTKVVELLKDEYWVLSSIKNEKYQSNETLYQAVSDYIKEERDI